MKYIVMLGDGMADRPIPALGGRTPLEAAYKPNMDALARRGSCGMARTVPEGMPPQSDSANLAVLGYDPQVYYSGRSPLEAVSMGVELNRGDVAIRCNLVTLSEEEERYEQRTMLDYSAGEISTEEARELIAYLAQRLLPEGCGLHPGISYRHCFVIKDTPAGASLTPPHDITGRCIGGYLPGGLHGEMLYDIMRRSYDLLKEHPINAARRARGEKPANSCWFWGEGTRPALAPFEEVYGLKGGVVCGVDLIKGLGLCAGMAAPCVPGATGAKRTDFAAKGEKALELLRAGLDLVYIHVEAPDESGHTGDIQCKVEAIEAIDRLVLGRVMEGLEQDGEEYAVLLLPDHSTPIELRTHSPEPVPFVLYRSDRETFPHALSYTEAGAAATGLYIEEGHRLMKAFTALEF